MNIGQARCPHCGYKTTTGGIAEHIKHCPKLMKAHPVEVPNSELPPHLQELIETRELEQKFIAALEIKDMRAGENPFIKKCIEICKEYAKKQSPPVEAAGVQEFRKIFKDFIQKYWSLYANSGKSYDEIIDEYLPTLPQQDSGYWQKLAEAQKEYSLFLENESNKYVQFAGIHGMIVPKEVFEKGEELRKKIYQLEIILSLKQQKGE